MFSIKTYTKTIFYFSSIALIAFNSCSKTKKKNTKEIQSSINSTFRMFIKNDRYEPIEEILYTLDKSKIQFNSSCTQAKVFYFRAIKAYYSKIGTDQFYFYTKQAENYANTCNNDTIKAMIYNNYGVYYSHKGPVKKALHYFEKSLEVVKKMDAPSFEVDTYYCLAFESIKAKNWKKVEQYALMCIERLTAEKAKMKSLKFIYIYLARAQFHLNKEKSGLKSLKQAEEVTDTTDHKAMRQISLAYDEYYESKGNYKMALHYAKKADSFLIKNMYYKDDLLNERANYASELSKNLDELKVQELKRYKYTILIGAILLIIVIVLLVKFYKLYKQFKAKKEKVSFLLEENEKTMFSKILLISTKNDFIKQILKKIEFSTMNNPQASTALLPVIIDIQQYLQDDEVWEEFKQYFEKYKPNFFKQLVAINSSLTQNDLKHCAYIATGLSSKEIALLIGQSVRSIDTSRYSLKKKLKLNANTTLNMYLTTL